MRSLIDRIVDEISTVEAEISCVFEARLAPRSGLLVPTSFSLRTIPRSFPTKALKCEERRPTSSSLVTGISRVRSPSPSAMSLTIVTSPRTGRVM